MVDIVDWLREAERLAKKDSREETLFVDAADEITILREENARLREALKPFADRLDELEKSPLTKYACATLVEIEHLRAARAAIREGGKDD